MTPENQQTVYTVLDCLALILPALLAGLGFLGIFKHGAKAAAGPLFCGLWFASCVWLALRGFGVIA